MKRFAMLAAALGLAVALHGNAMAQLKIGVAGPLTGPSAAYGDQLKSGAELVGAP